MPPRTPAKLWRELVSDAGGDAIETAAGATVEEAERDLRAAGFDVARERENAASLLDSLGAEEAPVPSASVPFVEGAAWVTKVEPRVARSRISRWPWLLAAALAAATTGGVLYAVGHRSKPVDKPVDLPHEEPTENAPAPSGIPSAVHTVPRAPDPLPEPKVGTHPPQTP